MPIYEYRCENCRRRVALFWRTYAAAEESQPVCPRCHSTHLTRLVSRVRVVRSASGRVDDMADPSWLSDLDENDPRSLGRAMRRMADEMGEEMEPEFEEAISRLEAGEDPEEIEKSMPELMGADSALEDDL